MSDRVMELRKAARQFATSDNPRAWRELAGTLGLYVPAYLIAITQYSNLWLFIPAMVITIAMTMRVYMIQHDCIHRSFFKMRTTNDITGKLLSPIAMTPYEATRYNHNLHHAHVSDLDRRDTFEIYVMTLREWEQSVFWKRLAYRIYRSPFVLVFTGPFIVYLLLRRFPLCCLRTGIGDQIIHNLLILGQIGLTYLIAGTNGLWVWLLIVYLTSTLGVLIPYIVHNFENIHWGTRPDMDFATGALEGSSVLDWGWLFHKAVMNIGYHDLHHLNAKIPGYKLKEAHEYLEAQGLLQPVKIGFFQGLSCYQWKLYDEEGGKMIPFPKTKDGQMITA